MNRSLLAQRAESGLARVGLSRDRTLRVYSLRRCATTGKAGVNRGGETKTRNRTRGSLLATLITTRSREYGLVGEHLDLDVLQARKAVELLTWRRQPKSTETEAVQLAKDLAR
jgi:hypothetical protein